MTDRPILFSAPMVQALLYGRKTQTRRVLKLPDAPARLGRWQASTIGGPGVTDNKGQPVAERPCVWHTRTAAVVVPRIMAGDSLYVREAFAYVGTTDPGWLVHRASYQADCRRHGFDEPFPDEQNVTWKPGIHMPRKISRLTLLVTDVRVEQLHDITERDAIAEGVEYESADPPFYYVPGIMPHSITGVGLEQPGGNHAVRSYAKLWNHINGAGAWESNPWVSVTTFTVEQRNIDHG